MKPLNISKIEAFDDNYIWLIHSNITSIDADNKDIIIVDPGDEALVIEAIQKNRYQPQAIFITHHHGDHCGGVKALVKQYKIPVYGPANEKITGVTNLCSNDDVLYFKNMDLSFKIIDVPGHTKGHIAFLSLAKERQACLFIGDTLFAGGCGKLFGGSFEQMQQSLSLLLELDEQTIVYCAHEYTQDNLKFALIAEPDNQDLLQRISDTNKLRDKNIATVPSLLKLEKQTNPFLRFKQQSLINSAEKHIGYPLTKPVDVFKTLRLWKDALDG